MQSHPVTQALSDWAADSTASLTVTATSIDVALGGALQAVLDVARGVGIDAAPGAADAQSISAPIRGQGDSYGEALYELANDLLAQLDANGSGLTTARVDGVLATDDGGYTAWGNIRGEASGGRPSLALSVEGTPAVTQTADGQTTVVVRLARS